MKNCWIIIFALFLASATSGRAQRYVKTFNTLDDAYRANLKDVHTNLFVLGRSAVNDGGGGSFFYDGSSSTTTNLGTVFGNVNGGRVKRVCPPGYVEAAWFGAKGDPSIDATAAIQSAIDSVVYGKVQLAGTNAVSNLSIKRGITLSGHQPWNTCLKALSGATGWMISLDELSGAQLDTEFNMVPSLLESFSMEGNARVSDLGAIYLNHCDYMVVRDVFIWRFQRSGIYLNTSVRESLFDTVSVRFCGKRDATNNVGGGWPGVSVVNQETSTSSVEDVHNGITFRKCEVVFSLGDGVYVDTRQIPTVGRKVNNIAFEDCWFHGWASNFSSVEFFSTLSGSSTLRQYNLVKVGAAYDVRFINNRFAYAGQNKPSLEIAASSLGGTPIAFANYDPEHIQVNHNFFNSSYTSPSADGEIGIKATAGLGVISDNTFLYLLANQDTSTGWKTTQPRPDSDSGLTFDTAISGSYANGTMAAIGTNPFTIHARIRMPSSPPTSTSAMFCLGSSTGTTSFPGLACYFSSDKNIYFIFYAGTISDRFVAVIPPEKYVALMGQVVDFVFTRNNTTLKIYLNGGEMTFATATAGAAPTWAASIPSTKWNLGASVGVPWPSLIHEFRVANRELSATDVSALSSGPKPSDMWGSNTNQSTGLITIGWRYRIASRATSDFTTVGSANNTVGTEFVATGTGSGLLDASNTLTRIGWVVDLDLTGNATTSIYDRTPNANNGTMFGNGIRWSKAVGIAPVVATVSTAPIDQPDRGYSWDGVQASSYINGTAQQLGTDPFTIHVRVRYPTANPTTSAGLYTLTTATGTIAAMGCGLYVKTDGVMEFLRYGATGSDVRLASVTAAQLSTFAGVPINLTVTRSGTNLAMYVNGTVLTYAEGLSGSAPTWGDSLTTDKYNIGTFLGAQPWVSTISAFRVANRALSATEVAALNRGVGNEDVWGSTTILNSGTLTVGKRYRIVARATSDFTTAGSANNTVGTEFVASTTGAGLLDASNTVRRIGWFLDVDLGSNVAGSVKDRTSNALNGTLAGAGAVQVPADPAPAVAITAADSPTWTGSHVFSKNGALSLPTVSVTGTPITGGTATTTKPLVLVETAGASSGAWSTSGTMLGVNAPSGFTGRPIEVQVNGSSALNLTAGGSLTIAASLFAGGAVNAGAAQNMGWSALSLMKSPSDGVIGLYNNASSGFTRLQLGGTTTSFPALGRSGTTIAVQLADGTAGGKLSVGTTQAKVGGRIDQKFTSTGTPASAVETDLYTYTAVASALGTDGDGIALTGGGTFAGNASATSQLRVYFGGTQIFASGALTAAAAGSWRIETFVIRDSSTSVRCITTLTTANAITVPLTTQTDVTGLTLSNTQVIKITGQGGGASPAVNDAVCKLGRIRFEPVY